MCIMNMHVNDCIYAFSCFPCYLGLTVTASFYLSPIIRFNKAYLLRSRKPLLYYFGIYVKRNNCVVKNIFIVSLLMHRGMATSWHHLITIFYIPFLWTFIYLTIFHSVPISTGSFRW